MSRPEEPNPFNPALYFEAEL